MLIEIESLYKNESLQTESARMSCENRLNGVILKYNISASDSAIIADGITEYVKNVVKDCLSE